MFLLDTDHISILQKKSQPACGRVLTRIHQHGAQQVFRSIVSFHEQTRGAHNYVNQARKVGKLLQGYEMFQEILEDYSVAQVLPFEQGDVRLFESLKQQHLQVGTMDLRIAATALARSLTVVTRNTQDFQKVPGLLIDDWTK